MVAWAQPLRGASVLEICCHDGEHGVVLARGGALVTSVDIVPELVELARRRIQENGVASRMTAKVMSVHALDLPSASFDVVFGKASLHHLDLELARAEILRVLRPGGVAIFAEPVRLSPRLAALRDIVPVAHDRDSPDERPLDGDDLARFTRGFSDVDVIYYRLLGRLGRIVPPAAKALAHVDRVLLDRVVALRSYAGVVVFRGRKPRR
jgi:SAM-dependent methyltransferase